MEEDLEHAILNCWRNQLNEISFFLLMNTSCSHFTVLIYLGFEQFTLMVEMKHHVGEELEPTSEVILIGGKHEVHA
jgi:hypothetical protein